jgi:hypothetical protein
MPMLALNAAMDAVSFYVRYGIKEMIWSEDETEDRRVRGRNESCL